MARSRDERIARRLGIATPPPEADVVDEPEVDPKTAARVQTMDALRDGTTNPADAVVHLVGAGFSKGEADRIVESTLAGTAWNEA